MAELELKNIIKSYDHKHNVLKGVSFKAHDGELVSILGPSGCGKSTTLNIIAGLVKPTSGQVLVDGKDISRVPVQKRGFGMVFQDYALFPKMTIYDNVAFGLRQHHVPKDQVKARVNKMLKITHLTALAKRYPKQLSGGQQQRVSLARGLVLNPKILLMDEPLSNLDANLRAQMSTEIRNLQKDFHITTIYVTHNQRECFAISDWVAIIHDGVIEQMDKPNKIYEHPNCKFVAKFVGYENILPVDAVKDGQDLVKGQAITVTDQDTKPKYLTINPSRIAIKQGGENAVSGEITSRIFLGDSYQYSVKTNLGQLLVRHGISQVYKVHTTVNLSLPAKFLIPLNR